VDQLYWGKHLQYRDKLPEGWFNKIHAGSSLAIHSGDKKFVITEHNFWTHHRHGVNYVFGTEDKVLAENITAKAPAFIVKLPKDIIVPPDRNSYSAEVHVTDWDIHPDLRAAYDKAVGILTIVDKWRAIHVKILEFFDSTKSVNEAVKLWPELITFLDPEDRQRLDKTSPTKKDRECRVENAKKVLASLDTQSIVADVVGIKMAAA
jgi:hypothetical protein